jgi:membrane protein DedA with SNARE-associated domain/uncharacterized tellurite resistance protein B-like protein
VVVAAASVVENIIPPAPADAVIALAAFLSEHGPTSAWTVFAVTWTANVAGAGVVYGLARRYGKGFFATRVGRRLLSPEAVVVVDRHYLRFGLAGLFVARLLPGFRSFTAPLAGLLRLGPLRAFVPIAAASALWYGTVVLLAARLGQSWDSLTRLLAGLNRTLAIVAGVAAVALGIWLTLAFRRHRREELRETIGRAYPALEFRALEDPAAAAVAALLLETTRADRSLASEELQALERHLRASWGLPGGESASPVDERAVAAIVQQLAPAERAVIFRRLRDAAFGEAALRRFEERVMTRAAQLLGVSRDQP